MALIQPSLFALDPAVPALPEGFRYAPELCTTDQEQQLLAELGRLPFKDFEFQGFVGKRRVVSFGWKYDFNERKLQQADELPAFLLPLRDAAAAFAGLPPDDLRHALITEYAPGAAIGWHRDKAVFDEVIGISLSSPCRFRFRRKRGAEWERAEVALQPRSVYLLKGPSRAEWEHSIPPMESLRYSITFRNFAKKT